MGESKLTPFASLLLLTLLSSLVHAQYWFQFGARGGSDSYFNNGAGVSIKTVTNQILNSGSLAYWVGETLQNGAFIQVGYLEENQSGQFPVNCTSSSCSGTEFLNAGEPVWFYEYFPPNFNKSFLGKIGTAGSVGKDGAINTYSFYSSGTLWYLLLNGNVLGKIDLGTGTSGNNDPVAFGELADTNGTWLYLKPVLLSNFSKYVNGNFLPLGKAYSYIGYGVGSKNNILDPYGVQEYNGRVNYFQVGSGLSQPTNNQALWSFGYHLNVVSQYGNISSAGIYAPYRTTSIAAPSLVYLGRSVREIFNGWMGKGTGSYTGPLLNATVFTNANITEIANWTRQYFVNVTSLYSNASGTGWYNATAVATYKIASNIVRVNSTYRFAFLNWSNGNARLNGTVAVFSPVNVSAIWAKQYYVNVTSQFANASGSGWYVAGSKASLMVFVPLHNITAVERLAFYSWNNGDQNSSIVVSVNRPLALSAVYKKQYKVNLKADNEYGDLVNVSQFYINGKNVGNSTFLFDGDTYSVDGAYYKGQKLLFDSPISISAPANTVVQLPLFNVVIRTLDVFGGPVNASATLEFSNGTVRGYHSDANGTIMVKNVPYGRLSGPIEYLGLTEIVNTNLDVKTRVAFISLFDLVVFGLAVIASLVFYSFARKRLNTTRDIQENKPGRQ